MTVPFLVPARTGSSGRGFLAGFLLPWPIVGWPLTRCIGKNAYPATHLMAAGRAVAEHMLADDPACG
jgi:hypothetical protein